MTLSGLSTGFPHRLAKLARPSQPGHVANAPLRRHRQRFAIKRAARAAPPARPAPAFAAGVAELYPPVRAGQRQDALPAPTRRLALAIDQGLALDACDS